MINRFRLVSLTGGSGDSISQGIDSTRSGNQLTDRTNVTGQNGNRTLGLITYQLGQIDPRIMIDRRRPLRPD